MTDNQLDHLIDYLLDGDPYGPSIGEWLDIHGCSESVDDAKEILAEEGIGQCSYCQAWCLKGDLVSPGGCVYCPSYGIDKDPVEGGAR